MITLGHQLVIFALLAGSIVNLWFTTLAVLKTRRTAPFLYFFLNYSLICFSAAGLFLGIDFITYFTFIYIVAFITGIIYLFTIRREDHARH